MAMQYWRNCGEPRHRFLTLTNSYHGDTVGAMSASARSVFTAAFEPMMFQVDQFSSLTELDAMLDSGVAAVLIEPMLQGAGGMLMWPAEFVAGVRKLCDKYGTLLIADEVLTGFGRTGKMFACEHAMITPDIICLSKGLTAGYMPLGVTAATEAIYEAFLSDDRSKTFFHGHSYTANPLACAVGIASLEIFDEEPVLQNIARLEQQLHAGFDALRSIGDVRVLGGVGVIELRGDGYLDQAGPRLAADFLKRDLLLRPLGNTVYFMPPYVISEAETEWAIARIRSVLSDKL